MNFACNFGPREQIPMRFRTLRSFSVPGNNAELRVADTISEDQDILRPSMVRLVELLDRLHKSRLECIYQLLPTRLKQPVDVMRTKNVAK